MKSFLLVLRLNASYLAALRLPETVTNTRNTYNTDLDKSLWVVDYGLRYRHTHTAYLRSWKGKAARDSLRFRRVQGENRLVYRQILESLVSENTWAIIFNIPLLGHFSKRWSQYSPDWVRLRYLFYVRLYKRFFPTVFSKNIYRFPVGPQDRPT